MSGIQTRDRAEVRVGDEEDGLDDPVPDDIEDGAEPARLAPPAGDHPIYRVGDEDEKHDKRGEHGREVVRPKQQPDADE